MVDDNFENLNMQNLRTTLMRVFFGVTAATTDEDIAELEKYVVPLQGNWYNPIQKNGVDNYIGYVIDSMSTDVEVINHDNDYLRSCKSSVHLSFIGKDAEIMAQSVLFWNCRADVKDIVDKKYKGVVNNKEFTVYSSFYKQEGLNSILCWNVDFSLQHNMLLVADSPLLTGIEIEGNITIGG